MTARLEGKSGIVTAAASGMGRAGAMRLAAQGAAVAVVDRDAQRAGSTVSEIRQAGGKAVAIVGDLTDDDFCRGLAKLVNAEIGAVDFVWNHAGHPGPAAFEDLDMDLYDLAMTLNVRAPTLITASAIPFLRQRGGGSVVFTASTAGVVGSPLSPIYSAAKFAVVGLTRALAKRYARENIRCNAVCPGAFDTPMLREFQQRPDAAPTGMDVEESIARFASMNPTGRNGRPEDIAGAIAFLVSDDAAYVNGAVLTVDGGMIA